MKSKNLLFVLLLISISFTACRKEVEEGPGETQYGIQDVYHRLYVKGMVFDSISGFAVNNAKVFQFEPYYHMYSDEYILGRTNSSGAYKGAYIWGGDPRYTHQPHDSSNVYINVYSDNGYGYIKLKFWQLIENDTIVVPNVYTKPIGYLQVHIKDTSGFGAGVSRFVYQYVMDTNDEIRFNNLTDTTLTWKAYGGRNVLVAYSYGITAYDHAFNRHVPVTAGDTTFVNMFY